MVTIVSLWLPIVLTAVAIWIASSIIWTVLPYHKSDYRQVPDEEATRRALKDAAPGQYNVPHIADHAALKQPEVRAKFEEGPLAFVTVVPKGMPNMGKSLVQWMIFNLLVAVSVAYLTSRTLPAGTEYLQVFRVAGTITWLTYGGANVSESVWFGRPWSNTAKQLVDAMIYALLAAGIFGAFWPDAT